MENHTNLPNTGKLYNYFKNLDIIDFFLCSLSIFFIIFFCRLSFYGLEFSDEGFYLNWIANSEAYSISYTQFGFLFGPLFDLLGNNVAFLRIASIIITFICGVLLTHGMLRKIFSFDQSITTISLAFALAVPVFLIHAKYFLLTPSYNTSTYIGVMLSLIVTLQLIDASEPKRTTLWVVLAACAVLLAVSKPTTAVLLGPTIIIFLFHFKQIKVRHFSIGAVATIVFFCSFALTVDGSLWQFIKRMQNGVEVIVLRDAGYSITEILIERSLSGGRDLLTIQNLLAAVLLFIAVVIRKIRELLVNRLVLIAVVLIFGGLILSTSALPTFIFYSITISGILAAFFRLYFDQANFKYSRQLLAWSILLLLMPPIYAFGTNNGLWVAAASATYFSLLAAILIFMMHFKAKHRLRILRTLSFILIIYTANYLIISASKPFRQTIPVWDMNTEVRLNNGTSLIMEPSFARYANAYLQLSKKNGFQKGDGIIDLSGRSPTIAFVLNGINLGTPWMNGGYPGGAISAARALDFVSCERLKNAWLITEPGGPRTLPISEFSRHEIYLQDYNLLGTVTVPSYLSGHRLPSTQYFYRPNGQSKLRPCNQ